MDHTCAKPSPVTAVLIAVGIHAHTLEIAGRIGGIKRQADGLRMRTLHVLQHALIGLTDLLLAQQTGLDSHRRTSMIIDLVLIELRGEGRIFQVDMRDELMSLRVPQMLTDVLLQRVASGAPMGLLSRIVGQLDEVIQGND